MKPESINHVRQNYLLISLVTACFIAVISVITIIFLEKIERQTREHSGFAIQTVLHTTDEALHNWANERIVEFSKWSLSDKLLALTKTQLALPRNRDALLSSPTLGDIRLFMREEMLLNEDIDVLLISPDYVNIASTDNENIGKTNIIAKQRKGFLEKVFLGNVQIVPAISSGVPLPKQDQKVNIRPPVTFIVVPIIDQDGTVIAALAIGLESDRAFNVISRLGRIGHSGETYFFNGNGMLLTESRFDKTLRDIGLIKPDQRGAGFIELRDPGVNMVERLIPALPRNKQPLTYMAKQAIDGRDGINIDGYRDYRGVRVLGTWKWNNEFGIGLATEIDEQEVLRPYIWTRSLAIGGISVTVLLSIIFVTGIVLVRRRFEEGLKASEEKYRNIIEYANDSIFISDPETREFIVVNHNAAKRLGYTKEELQSKRVEDISSSLRTEQIKENIGKLKRGESIMLETSHKRKDGKEIPVEISSKLVDYGGKKVVQSFVRDITERKKTEEAVLYQSTLLKNVSNAIVATDLELQITSWNKAAELLYGWQESEVLGKMIDKVCKTEFLNDSRENAQSRLQSEGFWGGELRQRKKNGEPIYVVASVSFIKDVSGNIIGGVTVNHDVTERKKAEEELAKHRDHLQELVEEQTTDIRITKEAAEKANRAKSEFLSNMSHELRTPMHAILSFADMGITKIDVAQKEKLKHYFSRIYESGERLLRLLNDLLDLSKLEAGKIVLELSEINLLNSVKSVAVELEPMLMSKSLNLNIVPPDCVLKVRCDGYQIQQVVRNLLSNSIKFTPEGKTITVTFGEEKLPAGDGESVPAVCFVVKDEGIGIPESEMETVFDKFIQSSKTRTGAGGTGLGLAICTEIVTAHGGAIRAENNPKGGAMFKVILPKEPAELVRTMELTHHRTQLI